MSRNFVSSPEHSFGSLMEDFEGFSRDQELKRLEKMLKRKEKELRLRE